MSFESITQHGHVDPGGVVFVGGPPVTTPIVVVDADPSWPAMFDELADRICLALGDRVLDLRHIGSTSVPELPAKAVIDIDLTVFDAGDEASYVPALARTGFTLEAREPRWHQHRLMVSTSPMSNLHVWSPGSPEVVRHRMFRDWLIEHRDDRARYAEVKRAAATASSAAGESIAEYNERKQMVVREILDRMFRAHGML